MCVCCGSGIECSDDEALDNGQDEEVSRWEQEQIRKGISIPQVGRSTRVVTITTFQLCMFVFFPFKIPECFILLMLISIQHLKLDLTDSFIFKVNSYCKY